MALLQGINNEALALSLFVDGVASRLPVSFTLANVSQVCAVLVSQLSVFLTQSMNHDWQDASACSFLRLVSPPQLPLVVGELLEPGPVFQAVNYAGQPTAGVIVGPDASFFFLLTNIRLALTSHSLRLSYGVQLCLPRSAGR
jgi:hypothetical protein